jgi:hypothetical protein
VFTLICDCRYYQIVVLRHLHDMTCIVPDSDVCMFHLRLHVKLTINYQFCNVILVSLRITVASEIYISMDIYIEHRYISGPRQSPIHLLPMFKYNKSICIVDHSKHFARFLHRYIYTNVRYALPFSCPRKIMYLILFQTAYLCVCLTITKL